MKKIRLKIVSFTIVIFLFACSSNQNTNTISIIHAGSLSLVVKQIADAYKKENPNIETQTTNQSK